MQVTQRFTNTKEFVLYIFKYNEIVPPNKEIAHKISIAYPPNSDQAYSVHYFTDIKQARNFWRKKTNELLANGFELLDTVYV